MRAHTLLRVIVVLIVLAALFAQYKTNRLQIEINDTQIQINAALIQRIKALEARGARP